MTSLERYNWACNTPSDISEHIPTLLKYARQCSRIIEFGVRGGVSTSAWLHAKPETLLCYDKDVPDCLPELKSIADQSGILFGFIRCRTEMLQTVECDLMFIDTLHTAGQIKAELTNYTQVRKFLIIHDTVTFGWQGEGATDGILFALMDFLLAHPEWRVLEHHTYNNGLTILGHA